MSDGINNHQQVGWEKAFSPPVSSELPEEQELDAEDDDSVDANYFTGQCRSWTP